MGWEVEFYRDRNGKEPLTAFLDSLPLKTRVKVVKLIELLADQGVLLKEPYTRQIRGKIRELRVKDHLGHVRVFYFTFTGRRFVLLHGFLKKTEGRKGRIGNLKPRFKPMIWPFLASLAPLREAPFVFCLLVPACRH